jgi:hypothetical protein
MAAVEVEGAAVEVEGAVVEVEVEGAVVEVEVEGAVVEVEGAVVEGAVEGEGVRVSLVGADRGSVEPDTVATWTEHRIFRSTSGRSILVRIVISPRGRATSRIFARRILERTISN